MSPSFDTDLSTYPQDIFNLVIDELRPDGPALRSCSLVSRPWLHISRTHLLREITVSVGDSDDSRDIARFTNALTTMSTGFAYYIRSLVIEGYATSGRLSRPRSYAYLNSGDLFTILDRLPNLNTLTLDHAKFISGGPDVKDLGKYPTLDSLRYRTTFQEGPYDYKSLFLQLFSHFPSVADLDLSLHSSPSLDEYPITFSLKHPRHQLKSLKLEASAAQGPVLKSLFNIISFTGLRSIEVVGTTSALAHPIGQIVGAASANLEKFSFQLHDVASTSQVLPYPLALTLSLSFTLPVPHPSPSRPTVSNWSTLNLSTCKYLTSISLAVPLTYSAHATQDRWNAAVSILSTLPLNQSLSIEILFTIESHQYWDTLDAFAPKFGYLSWTEARSIMNKLDKKNLLSKLEFVITTPIYPLMDDIPPHVLEVCQAALQRGFPELKEKNLLAVY